MDDVTVIRPGVHLVHGSDTHARREFLQQISPGAAAEAAERAHPAG